MHPLLFTYCLIIALASLFGGSLPSMINLTHRRIQLILSLVSGVMLGVALLHLLPHAIFILDINLATYVCLFGLLFMFFLIRTFHFHQHDIAVESEHDHAKKTLCEHHDDKHHVHCDQHDGNVDFSWLGLCFGLGIHTLVDGIALAAAVQIERGESLYALVGLSVFLAILLHKPLDAMSITSLMAARGWPADRQLVVNVVFCLMCPLGAILFALTVDYHGLRENREFILGIALAFSAGIFLCISLGDLLPEVHFHSHDRVPLSAMLLLGVLIALGIEFLPGHANHGRPSLKEKAAAELKEQQEQINPSAAGGDLDREAASSSLAPNN